MTGDARVCFGGGGGDDGVVKSNRSPSPELVFVAETGAGDIPDAESNAPKPLEELNARVGCAGGGAGIGLASKKLPPLRLEGGDEV